MSFRFLNPFPLTDGELSLVAPTPELVEDVVASATHPLTIISEPADAAPIRRRMEDFLRSAPYGRQEADPRRNRVPAYHFWMVVSPTPALPLRVVGGLGFRVGSTPELETFSGHIGYHVYPPARGRRFAERAARLVLPLARAHGMTTLWITCNPDNVASRHTCQRLGATLVDIVNITKSHEFYSRGERQKCRYRLVLD